MSCCENSWLAHGCEGNQQSCVLCGQTCCFYHGHSNNGGVKGGHARCRGECSTSAIYKMNCEGHMTQCLICKDYYCHYHGTGVAAGTLTGGHICDVTPQEPRQAIEESCFALASLSSLVYYVDDLGDRDGIKLAKKIESEFGYTLMPASIRTHGVCHMAVYEHGNKRVLAVKGTSASSGHDLLQDLKMVVGGEISRTATQATLGDATELISKFGVNLVTGHSLGGYYAEIIATTNRLCGVSFCNPGVNGPKVKLGGVPIRGFQNINFEHDALGNVYAGVYQHVQWSVYVSTGSVSHGIETMMEYFDGRRDITNMNVVRRSSSHMTGYYNPN